MQSFPLLLFGREKAKKVGIYASRSQLAVSAREEELHTAAKSERGESHKGFYRQTQTQGT